MKTVDLIVPCYNEEEVLPLFYAEASRVAAELQTYHVHYIFVDDGSKDKTCLLMRELAAKDPAVSYISFSRNFGKEAAIYAGLQASSGDLVVVMDADLQHPPAMLIDMIAGIEEGHDCVAAMRVNRKGESKIRSFFSGLFYKLSNRLSDVKMEQNAVDYRMMTRQMVDAILRLTEKQRFSKGLFLWVGFDTKWIPYENVERPAGQTKWNFFGLLKYAIDGIAAFSVAPLKFVTIMGCIISLFAFIYIVITLCQTLIFGIDVPGYVTTLCAVLFLGGVIEFSIGILGDYISRIYLEVKDRPIYITRETNIVCEEKEDMRGR